MSHLAAAASAEIVKEAWPIRGAVGQPENALTSQSAGLQQASNGNVAPANQQV